MTEVIAVVIQFIPLLLLLLLANGAESPRLKRDGERSGASVTLMVLSYVFLGVSYFLLFILGTLMHLIGSAATRNDVPVDTPGVDPKLVDTLLQSLPSLGASFWVPSLLGLLLLIPALRRVVARVLPIQSDHVVHTASLSFSLSIWIYFLFFISLGLDTIHQLTATPGEVGNPMPGLWAQQITFFFIALIGVGWLTRRNLKESLRRLGLVLPTLRQVLIGIGSGLLLVAGALLLENLAHWIGFTPDPHVEKLTEEMLGPLYGSVWGILTLGLSAALGEEAIFRGALLPRFGLILTTLLFTLLHSNYGLSLSTLVVFLVGLVLGLLRNRFNTSTTMVVHATYNISLGILASLYS
ncbi:membrane protease YdiL (CAAX protease family) [Kroppenstedtia sanguinis]|uniref:Type II CAAX prenyl endopeptidase Rce1 family protein n=1 Tax=Kroppenstedtia sanguinis TaxID=1380684 RepID=A0ABW4CAZ4_9BACL